MVKEQDKSQNTKVEKVPVVLTPDKMEEDGFVKFSFNQKLILPQFVKNINHKRKLAGEDEEIESLQQINVA